MTRLAGTDEKDAGLLGRASYAYSRRRFGQVPESLRVMAYHPRLLFGMGAMEMALERSHLVDERLKKLAEIKVATTVGCEFCIDIGAMLGRNLGVTERQLRELSDYRESTAFSPVEKLVLAYAEAISRTPATVPDELFEELRGHFDAAALVELTAAISWENYRARFNHAFGLGSQGFSEGAYCPLPEKPNTG